MLPRLEAGSHLPLPAPPRPAEPRDVRNKQNRFLCGGHLHRSAADAVATDVSFALLVVRLFFLFPLVKKKVKIIIRNYTKPLIRRNHLSSGQSRGFHVFILKD